MCPSPVLDFHAPSRWRSEPVYESHLRIWTQEVLHAFLEIVRIEKKEDGFAYGAIFIGMPEMEASRIQLYDTINNLTQAK